MMSRNDLKTLLKPIEFIRYWCAYFLLQYELITCTCMFEPWEKVFINGLVLSIFSLVSYSSWVYLPKYLVSLMDFVIQMIRVSTSVSSDC